MINIVDDMLAKHSDAEIVEYLYRQVQGVSNTFASVQEGLIPEMLLTHTQTVKQIEAILKALHKRNQERQAQANMV